jgi:hypothetical protein
MARWAGSWFPVWGVRQTWGKTNRYCGEVCRLVGTNGGLCGSWFFNPFGPSTGPKGQPFAQPGSQALMADIPNTFRQA